MMVVLSLFDGMSCGQLAFQRCGINVSKYYASEIDKYGIKVTKANFPNTIHLGDVRDIDASTFSENIDIIIGGSPCQSFSFAGKRNGMSTIDNIEITSLEQYLELKKNNFEFQGESYLFWEWVRLVGELKPKYFFLENVMMEERWSNLITKTLGVHPLDINSRLVSAQNRRRLYWTNIGLQPQGFFGDLTQSIQQPKDKGLLIKDILQDNPNSVYYLSDKMVDYVTKNGTKNYYYKSEFADLNGKAKPLLCKHDYRSGVTNYVVDEKYYLSEKIIKTFQIHSKRDEEKGTGFGWKPKDGTEIANCLRGNASLNSTDNSIIVHNLQRRSSDRPSIKDNKNAGGSGHLSKSDGKSYCLDIGCTMAIEIKKRDVIQLNESKESHNQQPFFQNRVYDVDGITPALCTFKSDFNIKLKSYNKQVVETLEQNKLEFGNPVALDTYNRNISNNALCLIDPKHNHNKIFDGSRIRRLTPIECERLQTVPDNYTNHCSDSQRYKMLGNGWTIDVIAHIFKHIKDEH